MWPLWSGHRLSPGEFLVLTARVARAVSILHLHCGADDEKPLPEGFMALGTHRERKFSWPENQPAPDVYRAQKARVGGKVGSGGGQSYSLTCCLRGEPPASSILTPHTNPIRSGWKKSAWSSWQSRDSRGL